MMLKNILVLFVIAIGGNCIGNDAVAFLIDIQGKVVIVRNNKEIEAMNSCEKLFIGDKLQPQKDASAKVMFEDAIFDIASPSRYELKSKDVSLLASVESDKGNDLKPSLTTRGNHLSGNPTKLSLPPARLLAQITSPITRGDNDAIILSPKGIISNPAPDIVISGKANDMYQLSIVNIVDSQTIGPAIQIKGCSTVRWADTKWPDLLSGEVYSAKVELNEKIKNTSATSFWLMSTADKEKMTTLLDDMLKNTRSETSQRFIKANSLYINSCLAEARIIAVELNNKEPNNEIFIALLKLCNAGIGIK